MKMNTSFEIVEIAEEYLAVPTGSLASSYSGLVSLTDATAFLLRNMKEDKTEEDLVRLLIENYEVDPAVAAVDVHNLIPKLFELRLITV